QGAPHGAAAGFPPSHETCLQGTTAGSFLSFEGHACNEIAGRTYLCAKSTFLEEVHVDEERCPCHRCRLPVRIGRGVRRGQEGEEGRQQGHVCRRQRVQGARRDVPIVLHGGSLAIGSVDPLDERLLRGLRELAGRIEPAYVSDHLCWGRHGGRYAHDLLPLPYTEEALAHVVSRVRQVQDSLGQQLLLENVSSYVAYASSTMTEWEFLARIAEEADCGILLDVNNV